MQLSLLQLGLIVSKKTKQFHLCMNSSEILSLFSDQKFCFQNSERLMHVRNVFFYIIKPEKKKHLLSQLYFTFASLVLGSKIFHLVGLTTFTFSF